MSPRPYRRPPVQGGSYTGPWPSDYQLQKMGLTRCEKPGCSTWLDSANCRGARFCTAHRFRKANPEKS